MNLMIIKNKNISTIYYVSITYYNRGILTVRRDFKGHREYSLCQRNYDRNKNNDDGV